ncbi:hypothetical protein GS445_06170 [Rhodococcus hoagii]|nr:hypothetical protein [Prescottella equi]
MHSTLGRTGRAQRPTGGRSHQWPPFPAVCCAVSHRVGDVGAELDHGRLVPGDDVESTVAMRWKPALNAFAITFEGRITPSEKLNRCARTGSTEI